MNTITIILWNNDSVLDYFYINTSKFKFQNDVYWIHPKTACTHSPTAYLLLSITNVFTPHTTSPTSLWSFSIYNLSIKVSWCNNTYEWIFICCTHINNNVTILNRTAGLLLLLCGLTTWWCARIIATIEYIRGIGSHGDIDGLSWSWSNIHNLR